MYHFPVHPKLSVGACNITLIAILEIFETSEKKVLVRKKFWFGTLRRLAAQLSTQIYNWQTPALRAKPQIIWTILGSSKSEWPPLFSAGSGRKGGVIHSELPWCTSRMHFFDMPQLIFHHCASRNFYWKILRAENKFEATIGILDSYEWA